MVRGFWKINLGMRVFWRVLSYVGLTEDSLLPAVYNIATPNVRISELCATREIVGAFQERFACRRCGMCCTDGLVHLGVSDKCEAALDALAEVEWSG
jgi:hypothetical protein